MWLYLIWLNQTRNHVYRYHSDYVSTKVRDRLPMAASTEAMTNDVLLVQIDSGGLLASAKRIIAIFASRL